jgi:hypothetical protein
VKDPFWSLVEQYNPHALDSIAQAWLANISSHWWSLAFQTNPIDSSLEIVQDQAHHVYCTVSWPIAQEVKDPLCSTMGHSRPNAVNHIPWAWQTSPPIACLKDSISSHCRSKGLQMNPIDSSLEIRSESSSSCLPCCVLTQCPSKRVLFVAL